MPTISSLRSVVTIRPQPPVASPRLGFFQPYMCETGPRVTFLLTFFPNLWRHLDASPQHRPGSRRIAPRRTPVDCRSAAMVPPNEELGKSLAPRPHAAGGGRTTGAGLGQRDRMCLGQPSWFVRNIRRYLSPPCNTLPSGSHIRVVGQPLEDTRVRGGFVRAGTEPLLTTGPVRPCWGWPLRRNTDRDDEEMFRLFSSVGVDTRPRAGFRQKLWRRLATALRQHEPKGPQKP